MSVQGETEKPVSEIPAPPEGEGAGFFAAREGIPTGETIALTPEQIAARKRRNVAIGLSLLAFCALVFVVTVIRIGQNFAQAGAV